MKGVEQMEELREQQVQQLAEEIVKATVAGNLSSKSLAVWLVEAGYRKVSELPVTVELIEFCSQPAVQFDDGDIIFQSESLTNFLMHLSILMPDCNLPDKLLISRA